MAFPRATFKVSRGLTYSYIHIEPTSPTNKRYILFLHGFPSLPTDYRHQIKHLSDKHGYGILAPCLLGYDDTSHPPNASSYLLKDMSNDIVEVLDHHSITCVDAVGHDWGVTLLSRLEFYHPSRVSSMAFLAIGAAPLGQPFDVDQVNTMTKQGLGYEGFGYMAFLARDAEAAQLIDARQESFRSLVFADDAALWKDHFGAIGGLKAWLRDDRRTDTLACYDADVCAEHERAFAEVKGGYAATLNWYKNHVFQNNTPNEADELLRRGLQTYQVSSEKPVLQILARKDPIALAPVHRQMAGAYASHATMKEFDVGHWVMLESEAEVSQELEAFFANTKEA